MAHHARELASKKQAPVTQLIADKLTEKSSIEA